MHLKKHCYFISLLFIFLFFSAGFQPVCAQQLHGQALADSLIGQLSTPKNDTEQVKLLIKLVKTFVPINPHAAMPYIDSAMMISQKSGWRKGIGISFLNKARIYIATSDFPAGLTYADSAYEIFTAIKWKAASGDALASIASTYERLGNYTKAVENNFKALSIYEEINAQPSIAWMYNNIGIDYYQLNDFTKSIDNYNKALTLQRKLNDKYGIASALDNIANVYGDEGDYEKVNTYNLQAIQLFEEIKDQSALGRIYINRGSYMQRRNNFDSAMIFYKKAIRIANELDIKRTLAFGYGGIGDLFFKVAKDGASKYIIPDSLRSAKTILLNKAYQYYLLAYHLSEKGGELFLMMQFSQSLSETEALRGNYKNALQFYKQSSVFKDSIYNDDNKTKLASLENQRITEVKDKEIQLLNKEKALRVAEQQKKDAETKRVKNIQYFTIAGLCLIVLAIAAIAFLQYRHSKQRLMANASLQRQKQKVETTLTELKSAQAQLVQSEKMASLGELTAGIAHEIQNPLNFVNNFSELNKELLIDMKHEIDKGNFDEVKIIMSDVIDNEEKINHHGKRADAIVKGMLQHSSKSEGVKENIDINALCEECLRLSYHGLRAKDKNFNADLKTDFDKTINKINIIPQDISRVLLNLFNNAFYAVNEKKKNAAENFRPEIFVQTKKFNNYVEIKVSDNGNGIPENIINKIFQPFFTTKPAGQGTGLGLSLSYDIIKAHGGDVKVETENNKSTTFVINIPA